MSAATLNDLEVPAYDVVDMATMLMTLMQDALEQEPIGGFIHVSPQQANVLFFASRLMMEKAEKIRSEWTAVHDAQREAPAPIRMTGGARS